MFRASINIITNEDYFFYGEDIDFCYRIKQGGYKIMYFPQVKITHFKGASSGLRRESQKVTTASKQTRKKMALASVDAMALFYKKTSFLSHTLFYKNL